MDGILDVDLGRVDRNRLPIWLRIAFPHVWGGMDYKETLSNISPDLEEFLPVQLEALSVEGPYRQVALWMALVWDVWEWSSEAVDYMDVWLEQHVREDRLTAFMRACRTYLVEVAGSKPEHTMTPVNFVNHPNKGSVWMVYSAREKIFAYTRRQARWRAIEKQAERIEDEVRAKRSARKRAQLPIEHECQPPKPKKLSPTEVQENRVWY